MITLIKTKKANKRLCTLMKLIDDVDEVVENGGIDFYQCVCNRNKRLGYYIPPKKIKPLDKDQKKICSRCKQFFPMTAEYFYRNKNTKSGFTRLCIDCEKETHRKVKK